MNTNFNFNFNFNLNVAGYNPDVVPETTQTVNNNENEGVNSRVKKAVPENFFKDSTSYQQGRIASPKIVDEDLNAFKMKAGPWANFKFDDSNVKTKGLGRTIHHNVQEEVITNVQNIRSAPKQTYKYQLHDRVNRWLSSDDREIRKFRDNGNNDLQYRSLSHRDIAIWKGRHCLMGIETLLHPSNQETLYKKTDREFAFLVQVIHGNSEKGERGDFGIAKVCVGKNNTIYHMMLEDSHSLREYNISSEEINFVDFDPEINQGGIPRNGEDYVMNVLENGVIQFTYPERADHTVRVYPFQ